MASNYAERKLGEVTASYGVLRSVDWEDLCYVVPDMQDSFVHNWVSVTSVSRLLRMKFAMRGYRYLLIDSDGDFSAKGQVLRIRAVRALPPCFYDHVQPSVTYGLLGSWVAKTLPSTFRRDLLGGETNETENGCDIQVKVGLAHGSPTRLDS